MAMKTVGQIAYESLGEKSIHYDTLPTFARKKYERSGEAVRNAALEEAAKIADSLNMPPHQFVATEVARNIAMQIRALKQKS
jgi:hypothetical protein